MTPINQLAEKAAEAIDIHIALNETDFKRSNLAQIILTHFTPLAAELEEARRLLEYFNAHLDAGGYTAGELPQARFWSKLVKEAEEFLTRTNPTKP